MECVIVSDQQSVSANTLLMPGLLFGSGGTILSVHVTVLHSLGVNFKVNNDTLIVFDISVSGYVCDLHSAGVLESICELIDSTSISLKVNMLKLPF